jgi:hypothetical protein
MIDEPQGRISWKNILRIDYIEQESMKSEDRTHGQKKEQEHETKDR